MLTFNLFLLGAFLLGFAVPLMFVGALAKYGINETIVHWFGVVLKMNKEKAIAFGMAEVIVILSLGGWVWLMYPAPEILPGLDGQAIAAGVFGVLSMVAHCAAWTLVLAVLDTLDEHRRKQEFG